MANPQKEVKELRREAERQGWRVEKTKRHWKFYAPDGVNTVVVSATPSGPRWKQNTVAELRRYGFKWKGR